MGHKPQKIPGGLSEDDLARLGLINQEGPISNTTYSRDDKGNYTQHTDLDPRIKGLLDSAIQGLQGDVDVSGEGLTKMQLERWHKEMDPQWEQKQKDLETKLASQGITEGSDLYRKYMEDFNRDKSNAENNALLTGQQQAFDQVEADRNRKFGEFGGLAGFGRSPGLPDLVNPAIQSRGQTQSAVAANNQRRNPWGGLIGTTIGIGSQFIPGVGFANKVNTGNGYKGP